MNTRAAFQGGPIPAPSLHDGSGGTAALYFFYKSGQVRAPLDFSNNTILNLLKNSGIGFWDRENHQFVMAADFITKAVINHLFYAYAQVYIDEGLPEPTVTQAIWRTPWEGATDASSRTAGPDFTAAEDTTQSEPKTEPWLPPGFSMISGRQS